MSIRSNSTPLVPKTSDRSVPWRQQRRAARSGSRRHSRDVLCFLPALIKDLLFGRRACSSVCRDRIGVGPMAPVACLKASLGDLQTVLCCVSFPPAVRAAGLNHTSSLLVMMKAARQAGRGQPPPPSSRGTPLPLNQRPSSSGLPNPQKYDHRSCSQDPFAQLDDFFFFFFLGVGLKPADMDGIATFTESFFFLCHFLTNLFAGRCK